MVVCRRQATPSWLSSVGWISLADQESEIDLMSVSDTEPRSEEQNTEKDVGRMKRRKVGGRR